MKVSDDSRSYAWMLETFFIAVRQVPWLPRADLAMCGLMHAHLAASSIEQGCSASRGFVSTPPQQTGRFQGSQRTCSLTTFAGLPATIESDAVIDLLTVDAAATTTPSAM